MLKFVKLVNGPFTLSLAFSYMCTYSICLYITHDKKRAQGHD